MFLDKIIEEKKQEIAELKLDVLKSFLKNVFPPREFTLPKGLKAMSLIAEVKKKSPSVELFRPDFDPVLLAKQYEDGGANAISVLTDRQFFGGHLNYLRKIKEKVNLPLLRKDFIISEKQIYESRIAGADAILLIVAILEGSQLQEFLQLSEEVGLVPLVEVHSPLEMEKALEADPKFIGINNRDLKTFQVDLKTTIEIMDEFPELKSRIVVSESGIESGDQVEMLKDKGVSAILVGEALLKARDIRAKIKELTLQ